MQKVMQKLNLFVNVFDRIKYKAAGNWKYKNIIF